MPWLSRWLVVAALVAVMAPAPAAGHGGQRIVPIMVESEGGEPFFRVRYSFDVGLLLEGVSVDREWLAAQTIEDLQEIADDASVKLGEWYRFSVAGEAAPGVFLFPDLDRLGDLEFDNGEPPGHVLVEQDVAGGAAGGAVVLELSAEAPGTVVTRVVGGKAMRRPVVLLAGESRELLVLEGDRGEAEGEGAGGEAEIPAGVMEEIGEIAEEVAEEEVRVDRLALVGDGFRHVWDWRGGHFLLALALFLGCRGWKDVAAQFGGLATGSVMVVLIGVGFGGGWTGWAYLGLVMALAADAGWGDKVRPWRVVMAMAVGIVHGGQQMAEAGDWAGGSGELLAVVAGPVLGDGVLVFLSFVALGWGWGTDWFGKRVRRPLSWLVFGAGAVLVVL